MKLQFTTSTILLITAFVAITCAGFLGVQKVLRASWWETPFIVFLYSPLWLPPVMASYAIARRRLTARFCLVFAIPEALAFAAFYLTSKAAGLLD